VRELANNQPGLNVVKRVQVLGTCAPDAATVQLKTMGALIFALTSLTSWQPKTSGSASRPYVALRTLILLRDLDRTPGHSRLNPIDHATGCPPKGGRRQ
jgi:hypothetical protein